MKTRQVLATFNRGRISRLAMARGDVSRVALSADQMTNWMPRALGPMSLRPGLQYIESANGDGALLPFIYQSDDVAILEFTASTLRIFKDGDTLITRPSVATTISNGGFTSDLSGWTQDDDSGAVSSYSSGQMKLFGTGYADAKRYQEVSVGVDDRNTAHALRIVVTQGKALLRVGTTAGDDDIFRQAVLREGTHSIAFTPGAASFFIEFSSSLSYPVFIDSVAIESSGTLELPTPWTTATECKALRWAQNADVVFLAAGSAYQQRRIERRDNDSWSIAVYQPTDGPWQLENTDKITMTPSDISGEITLTSSRDYFRDEHVGCLFRLTSAGQRVEAEASSDLVFTDPVRVTGTGTARQVLITLSGTYSATISLQRSLGAPGSWTTVVENPVSAIPYNDALNNVVAYYRIGIEAGNYTSGTVTMSLAVDTGSITGAAKCTSITSSTEINAIVLEPLGTTAATEIWAEGAWSDLNGWPESGTLWEGRMWWQAKGKNYASSSDIFDSFDPDDDGDGGPINKLIGDGANTQTNWALPLQRLVVGTDWAEHVIRSNNFDEPVTSSNYNSKAPSTYGSAPVPAVYHDGKGYFVDVTTRFVFELQYSAERYDFGAMDLTKLCPEITESGIVRMAVQKRPDMRLHAIKADGTVALMVRDELEDVLCWVDVETDGAVEDVVILPGEVEDQVFYRVRRTVDGNTVRYLEKWAREDQCIGGTVNRQADSFIVGTGAVDGLDHLEGEAVVIWGDGEDQGTGTVSGGAVSGHSYSNWMAGLTYRARYKSSKLAAQTQLGFSLTQRSRINQVGLVLDRTHWQGLQIGPTYAAMNYLPGVENAQTLPEDKIWDTYDEDMITFPGQWATDNRICMEANAPRPVTVLAAVINIDRQDAY